MVWLVIALAMYRHWSISEVLDNLDLALPDEAVPFVSKSAVAQARQRIGEAPLAWLFEQTAHAWTTQDASRHAFKGLSLWAIDGTTLRTADSPVNREHFGAQGYASGKVASYPQVRAVTLTAIPTHLVADINFGRYDTNEMVYAKSLLPQIPDALAGTWSGTVRQTDPSLAVTVRIQLTVGSPDGTIAYPQLGCAGRLQLVSTSGTSYTLEQGITSGEQSCDSGVVTLTPQGSAKLAFAFRRPGAASPSGVLASMGWPSSALAAGVDTPNSSADSNAYRIGLVFIRPVGRLRRDALGPARRFVPVPDRELERPSSH